MTTQKAITLADIEIQLSVLAQIAKAPAENPSLLLSFLAERLAHAKRDIQKLTQEMTALCGGKVGGGCGGNLTDTANTQENRQDSVQVGGNHDDPRSDILKSWRHRNNGEFPPPTKHQPKWSVSR